jgi:16S rRNA (cytosine967-C5)-methyltransferase
MPSLEGVAARRAALRLLDQVLRRGDSLEAAGAAASGLAPQDAALATAIAGEVLRRLPDLDALIDSATRQPLPPDSKARAVLRMALAQKAALNTPDHAVVATALPLVDGGPRRLVHGVLGTLLRRGLPPLDSPRLPEPVEQRWSAVWGRDTVTAARRLIARRPPLDLSFADQADAGRFAAEQGGVSLLPGHVRLHGGPKVTDLPGFADGGWWVQDLAASLPARLIPAEAELVLDACAAPGGKTLQLAAAGKNVTALDRSESRLERLRDNLRRTGLQARLLAADALAWAPDSSFDAVLLDAPCSSTGTFRRHPEVLHRVGPRVIAEATDLQRRLLRRAATWVRPGGTLVYSVCSLEPEEGEQVIADFLASSTGFAVAPATAALGGLMASPVAGAVRTLPGQLEAEGGLDGFFAVRLVRAA